MNFKRFIFLKVTITIAVILLVVRVFYLQIIDGKDLARSAAAQRMVETELPKPRGNILDKYGIPLTNRSVGYYSVLFPQVLKEKPEQLDLICKVLGLNSDNIAKYINTRPEPMVLKSTPSSYNQFNDLKLSGVTSIEALNRYDVDSVAKHVVGYIKKSNQAGEAGLEKAYDKFISEESESAVGVVTDARFKIINGLGYRMIGLNSNDNLYSVKTTLDYQIQRIVENVLEENRINGAVVIEDVTNGDIVAMCSKPDFDQSDVAKYLENSNNALFNRAVAAYSLGSIFKIVDVAAFLEHGGDPNTVYYCPGYVTIGDTEFRCSSYAVGGHGNIDLKRAFASSCNSYFINLDISMGTKSILEMATRLGLGSELGLSKQGVPEANGMLPVFDKNQSAGYIANMAIGQGDVLATPVQIANMVAIVANGGIKNSVNIVDSIVDKNLNKKKVIRENSAQRVLSKGLCQKIKEYMEEVTQTGTGTRANLSKYGGAAGKTGSAETGQLIGDKKVVHAWFAGYFPLKSPKYSVAVFIEGGESGAVAAAPIFADIAQEIMRRGL